MVPNCVSDNVGGQRVFACSFVARAKALGGVGFCLCKISRELQGLDQVGFLLQA